MEATVAHPLVDLSALREWYSTVLTKAIIFSEEVCNTAKTVGQWAPLVS